MHSTAKCSQTSGFRPVPFPASALLRDDRDALGTRRGDDKRVGLIAPAHLPGQSGELGQDLPRPRHHFLIQWHDQLLLVPLHERVEAVLLFLNLP